MSEDALLDALIAAPSAAGRRAVLRRHPELVSEAYVERLKSLVEKRLRRSAKEARRVATAAAFLAEAVGTPVAAGTGLVARAFLEHGTGRFGRAIELYDQAERRLRQGGSTEAADRVLLPRFDALARAGDEDGARRTAARARRAFARRGLSRWVVMVDMNLGSVHHRAGRLRPALACYDRAATELERLGARAGMAVNDVNRANVLALIGRHGEAEDLFARSALHFRERGQTAAAALADYNRATLLFQQGEFSGALAALAEVEAIFASENDARHLAHVRLDRADILLRLGQVEAAEEEAGRARRGFRRLGLAAEAALADGLAALAGAERRPGGRRGITRAVAELVRAGWRSWAASLSVHEAGLALKAGDPDEAARLIREALPTLTRAELPDRIAIARLLRARADEARGRLLRARRGYRQVLETLARVPLGWIAWRAHHGLARLAWRAGDRREAERRFRAAERELEAVRDALAGDEVRGGLLEDSVPLYEDHVLFLLEGRGPRRCVRAFELLERARARTLLAGLQGIPSAGRLAGQPEAEAILTELRALQRRVAAALHGDATSEDRRARPPRIHRAELGRAERRARVLQIRLESLAGPGADPSRPVVPGVDAIRERLHRDETLVAYSVLGDRLVAFLLGRRAVSGPHDLADRVELERAVEDLRHDLSRRPVAARLRDAARLSTERRLRGLRRLLVDPIEQDLASGPLLVAPWGCLHGVPFHALLGAEGPLAAGRAVVRVPSAGSLWLARGGRRSRGLRSLVLGVPDARVPRVEEECRRLADRLTAARVACGEGATAERLRRDAPGARVVHVATHGLFRPESPRLSAFLLADGWFGLADVYGLRLRADLVVLSSCDGGLGGRLSGGESLGLARAFLLAGARALLSALGPVRDDAAAFFMEEFYGSLGQGVPVAEAHRRAILAAREEFIIRPSGACSFSTETGPPGSLESDMRVTMPTVVFLLALAAVAAAADADLAGRVQRIEGDLGLAETDRIAFAAPAGTRLDVRLEGDDIQAPGIRVVGPSGVLDSAPRLRVASGGRKVRLKWLRLEESGSYRVELVGADAGEYEGRIKLDIPSKVTEEVQSPGPVGPPDVAVVLPPGAEWKKIRVKPRSGGPTVDVASFSDPEGGAFAMSRRERSRGFQLAPVGAATPGFYVLRLSHVGGAGGVRIKVKYRELDRDVPVLDLADGLETGGEEPGETGATQGEVLVRLAKGTRLDDFLDEHDDIALEEIVGTGYYRVVLEEDDHEDDDDEEEALEELFEDPSVLHVERNLLAEAPEGGQSSIPVLDDNLDDEQARTQPSLDRIGVLAAHAATRGAGVVVAVLDTGVDASHPFLSGRVAPGGQDLIDGDDDPREERNGLDDDGDGEIDEGYGHGTFVAGLVLAVAPEATILPFRVLDSDARGEAARIAEAVILAVESGVHVINLSLGTTHEARVIREAVRYAHERDVLVVVAAGNEADQIEFPARYGNTLAVTAVDADAVAAEFTNLGSTADLAAPGVDVIGPLPTEGGVLWGRWSGTSFAAPLVSGSAALLRAVRPDPVGDGLANRLMDTAEDLEPQNPDVASLLGEGLVRPDRAVEPE